jgi:hypothetical protein
VIKLRNDEDEKRKEKRRLKDKCVRLKRETIIKIINEEE